jgi:hypothetical protein
MRAIALLLLAPLACARREPPTPDGSPSIALPELAAPAASPPMASAAVALVPSQPVPSASVDPATLPQTRDRPSASGPAFDARVAALWAGIVEDDPDRAMPFFFPLPAYVQVKDVADPGSDWKRRLVAAYARDIHGLHARLGDGAHDAKLTELEVPEARARWVDPGEEYNKLGYYRVFSSRLRYDLGGSSHTMEVKSLISWRGEWFVVHLGAIR